MRALNRSLATLLALILLLGGLLAVVEIVLAALHRPAWLVPRQRWTRWLAEQGFDSGIVRATLIGIVLLGVVLLVAAVRPGSPRSLRLPATREAVEVTAARRGIERTLAAAARRPDGVQSARVRARRRTVRVRAVTSLREPGDLQQRVSTAVDERLAELGMGGRIRSRITIARTASR